MLEQGPAPPMTLDAEPLTETLARPDALFGEMLTAAADGNRAAASDCTVRWADGTSSRLDLDRWLDPATPDELSVLEHVEGPVLDVGCGPGRHVLALKARWTPALGIDSGPVAAALARQRGAHVLTRSVFDEVPCAGRWGTALLLDGNIGIGGDPTALLRRVRALTRPTGLVIVELEQGPLRIRTMPGHLETPYGRSTSFVWSRVGPAGIADIALASGFDVVATSVLARRCFARLRAVA